MRSRASLIVTSAMCAILALTGCASGGGATPVASATPRTPSATPPGVDAQAAALAAAAEGRPEDPAARARAEAWIDALRLPEGAVRSSDDPGTAPGLGAVRQGWWCAPMALATSYWTIEGATLAEAFDHLAAQPADGLVSTASPGVSGGDGVDLATLGHVPAVGALEGMALTVAPSASGVVVRAEAGAMAEDAQCPTPGPGEALGGVGMG